MELRASEIDESPRCIACGYDLRSLSFWGDCPECGLAIERSIGGDKLARAHPDWLSKVVRGQTLMLWGVRLLAAIVPMCLLVVLLVLLLMAWNPSTKRVGDVVLLWLPVALVAGGLPLIAAGVALIMAPDRGVAEAQQDNRPAMLAWSGLAGIVVCFIAIVVIDIGPTRPARPPGSTLQADAIRIAAMTLAWFVSLVLVAALRRVAWMMDRIPNQPIARRSRKTARTLMWCVPVFLIAMGLDKLVFEPMGLPSMPPFAFLSALDLATRLIYGILFLVLLVHLFAIGRLFTDVRDATHNCLAISQELSRERSSPAECGWK